MTTARWKPVLSAPLAHPGGEEEEQDMFSFTLEQLDGDYEIVNGQIVMLSSATATRKNASSPPKPPAKKPKLAPVASPAPPPLTSNWKQFDRLHPSLINSLEAMGFSNPTPIQTLCLPAAIVRGKDVLGCAETGSGKTLAYGLPILSDLLTNGRGSGESSRGPFALVLTPTRELTLQVVKHLRHVLEHTGIEKTLRPRIEAIVGGLAVEKQERILALKPEVLCATVGRFWELLQSSQFEEEEEEDDETNEKDDYLHLAKTTLRYLVIDEADRMVDSAHFSDFRPLIEFFTPIAGEKKRVKRQTMLFSATLFPTQHNNAHKNSSTVTPLDLMARLGMRGKPEVCNMVTAASSSSSSSSATTTTPSPTPSTATLPARLKLYRVECADEEREVFLNYLFLKHTGSFVVFVNTINVAKRLMQTLALLLPPSEVSLDSLHAHMDQKQRLRHLERFASSTSTVNRRVLVATDVAARGLDIPNVDFVVHFSIPSQPEVFIHRSGRTGRAGKEGTAVALVGGSESRQFSVIRKHLLRETGRTVDPLPVGADVAIISRLGTRVKLARRAAILEKTLKADSEERAWFKRHAEEADLPLEEEAEEEDADEEDEDDEKQKQKRKYKKKKKKLRFGTAVTDADRGSGGVRSSLRQLEEENAKNLARRELQALKRELSETADVGSRALAAIARKRL